MNIDKVSVLYHHYSASSYCPVLQCHLHNWNPRQTLLQMVHVYRSVGVAATIAVGVGVGVGVGVAAAVAAPDDAPLLLAFDLAFGEIPDVVSCRQLLQAY